MADVKWIKITTDVFDDEKILLIESLPDSYAIITVWFKLLCLAGKQNNSGVFMMNNQMPYTEKMLSTIFRMKEATVTMALQTFEQFGMVEIIDGVITIPNWNKHQSLDAYEKKKIRDRLYQAERRAAQKALIEKSSDKSLDTSSDIAVSDIDKEKEIDIDKDNNIILSDSNESDCSKSEIYKTIISYLNEKAGTGYKATSKKTQSVINGRIAEGFTVDDFTTVIDKKCAEWLTTEFEQYLRPSTLFGTKFESYLNAPTKQKQQNQDTQNTDFYKNLMKGCTI